MPGEKKYQKKEEIIKSYMDQMVFDLKRGFLQFIVLSLISQEPKYAYQIKDEVYEITGGEFDIDRNNLYKRLRTMEAEGILKSREKPSVQGANRKYYSLTPFGKKFFRDISSILNPVIESFYERVDKAFIK